MFASPILPRALHWVGKLKAEGREIICPYELLEAKWADVVYGSAFTLLYSISLTSDCSIELKLTQIHSEINETLLLRKHVRLMKDSHSVTQQDLTMLARTKANTEQMRLKGYF